MGYTHYWELNGACHLAARMKFATDVLAILKLSPVKVQFESDSASPPVVTQDLVRFNGADEDGYETFYFESGEWSFCKTAHRPYDVVVTACLLAAKFHFEEDLALSTDGGWEDWAKGLDLFRLATGRADAFAEPLWEKRA